MGRALPEADPVIFAAHVRIPILILSDRYVFAVESSQHPFFRAFGTADKDKRRVIFESGHRGIPRHEYLRESLDWLDQYLGPVRRK